MAFLGMLGHLAHPVTTSVWDHDECSLTPARYTVRPAHTHGSHMGPNTRHHWDRCYIYRERAACLALAQERKPSESEPTERDTKTDINIMLTSHLWVSLTLR